MNAPFSRWVAVLALAFIVSSPTGGDDQPSAKTPAEPLSQREIAFHVLNRLAFGPRPGGVDDLLRRGWMAWAIEQLDPEKLDDAELEQRVRGLCPSLHMSCTEVVDAYRPERPKDRAELTPGEQLAFQQEANRLRAKAMREIQDAVLLRAALSRRQLFEVMANFWRNHFSIDQRKDQCELLAGNYEEQVVRKHVFGKFEDMLLAAAKHPAMLVYLDNVLSQRPLNEREKGILERSKGKKKKSEYIQKLERQRGLNENFARELMELHTIGVINENVPGGYSQRDVIEIARSLTGWSVSFGEAGVEFLFRAAVHDDEPKAIGVLNLKLPAGGGVEEGEEILRRLARHPLTARFLAWKLCRYLVNDRPSDALVQKIADEYLKTGGDLRAVTRAVLFSDEFYARENFRTKFRTPFEFTVSALRATGSSIDDTTDTLQMLQAMGQPIYQCTDPTGYYDQAEAWLDPGVLVYRWQFALRLAAGQMRGITLPRDYYLPILQSTPQEMQETLIHTILPGGIDAATESRCGTLLAAGGKPRETAVSLLGALLGSPTFQEQ